MVLYNMHDSGEGKAGSTPEDKAALKGRHIAWRVRTRMHLG